MTDARVELAELAAEIRKQIAPADDHVPDGYWWYDGGRDGELPEALAADLLAAGWRPLICHHTSGRAPDGGRWCTKCGRRLDQVDG